MNTQKERCQHCGKWVSGESSNLFTLFEMAGGHKHEEDVAICSTCGGTWDAVSRIYTPKYSPEYWRKWLDEKFKQERTP